MGTGWATASGEVQFCVEASDRTGGKDYCPLSAAPVQVMHENDTATPHAVYAKLHLEKGLFYIQSNKWCMID